MDITNYIKGFGDYARMGLKGVLQYLNMPSLSGIRLECFAYDEVLESKVSSQMLVSFDNGKNVVNDNIAPLPRTWNIGAYIGSATIGFDLIQNAPNSGYLFQGQSTGLKSVGQISYNILGSVGSVAVPGLEPSVYFMPSLKQQKDILTSAWKNDKLVWFVDKYKNYIPVAIERCVFASDPSIQNKLVVQLTIKEIVVYQGYGGGFNSQETSLLGNTFQPDIRNPATGYVNSGNSSSTFMGSFDGYPNSQFNANAFAGQ